MTSDVTERRLRRRAAQQLFDELAVDYLNQPRVNRARMFGRRVFASTPSSSPSSAAKGS